MDEEFLNRRLETMSSDELRSIQESKFLKQLDYVLGRSPFYQRKFAEAGIERGDIRGLGDLPKIPFTEKDELRKSQEDHPPLGFHAAADMVDVMRIHSSSGTTGVPTFIGITKRDHQVWTEITARSLFTQGLRRSDVVIHAVGLSFFVGGLPVKDAIEYLGATFVPIGTGASDRVVMTARKLGANVLHSTPSYALYLAEYVVKKYGMSPSELGFRKFVVGAEPGGGVPSVRKKIQADFGSVVLEGMGNSDAAPIIFGECRFQEGMHFCAQEYIVCELIDPETGRVLEMSDGAQGELVYTLIERESCPVLRFRTRDRVTVWSSRCSCGRTSFRVRCIGRTDDMLVVRGVNLFPSAIKDIVASFSPRTTGDMIVVLDGPGPAVEPPVNVQVEYGSAAGDLAKLKTELEQEIRNRLVVKAEVQLVPQGTLPRFEMKARLVKQRD